MLQDDRNEEWRITKRIGIHISTNQRVRVDEDGEVIVESRVRDRDVTSECSAELMKSYNSDGYYVIIRHNGVMIASLGIGGFSRLVQKHKEYYVVLAKGATVSFKVFMKC